MWILTSTAQFFPAKNYPQHYFAWPLRAKIALAANFGELRPNHYHMGLDCKTDQKENVPVLAAADGYISKVKVEPFGFGQAIYINHPNGLTTLYAHLNSFFPELEKYVTEQQYEQKSWKIFIDIPANLFPVKKGQFIANSGNTGGSQGPHLHFEIRDTKTDKALNPLLFGFPVADNIPPDILRLAVYDRNRSTFEQSPRFFPLRRSGSGYIAGPISVNTDKISFGITAYDRYTGSTNKNGIFEAVLYDNEKPIVGFQLDSITYDETRYLNAHIDYRLHNAGGSWVQHLSRLPGYPINGVYKQASGDGVIRLKDDELHHIRIEVKDADGNVSVARFDVKKVAGTVAADQATDESLYQSKEFHPGFLNIYENDDINFYLTGNQLYDSLRFRFSKETDATGNPVYHIHSGDIPVHAHYPLRIKNRDTEYPGKMVMYRSWNNKKDYAKANRVMIGNNKDWYQAAFRAFGNFQLLTDLEPPTITPIGFYNGANCSKQSSIKFVITDNTEELQNFSATLDGKQWLKFSNDKGKVFTYRFDEHCPPGNHELTIHVEDCVGNVAERSFQFTR